MTAPRRRADRKTEYVSVDLTPDARDALRRFAIDLSHALGRRVSMSDAAIYAVGAARNNPPLGGEEKERG